MQTPFFSLFFSYAYSSPACRTSHLSTRRRFLAFIFPQPPACRRLPAYRLPASCTQRIASLPPPSNFRRLTQKNLLANSPKEYARALTASKEQPITSESSQEGIGVGAQGHYTPAIAGGSLGQPRPTQPVPLGGGLDMHRYAANDEEMIKL